MVDGLPPLLLHTVQAQVFWTRIGSSESPQLGGEKEQADGEHLEMRCLLNLALSSVGGQRSKGAAWAEVFKRDFLEEEETLRIGLEGWERWVDDETMGR